LAKKFFLVTYQGVKEKKSASFWGLFFIGLGVQIVSINKEKNLCQICAKNVTKQGKIEQNTAKENRC